MRIVLLLAFLTATCAADWPHVRGPKIDHFRRYPAMLPYVGEESRDPSHRRLLILGESNYLPKESSIHLDSHAWYAGDQTSLSAKEVE